MNIKVIWYGCKYEDDVICVYENEMKKIYCNFIVIWCGFFINKKYFFLYVILDFLILCDCCGFGCGEVKCFICIKDCDFEKYILEKNVCLEKVDGVFCLKRYYYYYF